jgi:hypothetical protein
MRRPYRTILPAKKAPPSYPIARLPVKKRKRANYRIFPPETAYLLMLTNPGAAYSRTGMELV